MTTLSVIILTYNSEHYIVQCLESFLEIMGVRLDASEVEIIVFDNDSSDQTVALTKKFIKNHKISNIHMYENAQNLGFAKGINAASKLAKGDFMLFINPDTQLVNDKILDMINQFDKGEKVAVVGGKIQNFDGKTEKSAGKFYTLTNLLMMVAGMEEATGVRFSPQKNTDVDFVSGGFMVVRKDTFEQLKGFDEKLFMYVEDMEFCYRVKKKGLRIIFIPNAIIKHIGQGSSSREFAIQHIYTGILYFYKKHRSTFEYTVAKLLLISKAKVAIMIGLIMKRPALVQTYSKTLATIQ